MKNNVHVNIFGCIYMLWSERGHHDHISRLALIDSFRSTISNRSQERAQSSVEAFSRAPYSSLASGKWTNVHTAGGHQSADELLARYSIL